MFKKCNLKCYLICNVKKKDYIYNNVIMVLKIYINIINVNVLKYWEYYIYVLFIWCFKNVVVLIGFYWDDRVLWISKI